ncbi:hypothetical protein QBC39DRAFT_391595 [Podospora conica]|nr:hypothetical protein QBC39DRAFT_391595 [Schizothecium conicum]
MPPPAMLEDPSAATIYRVSGDAPYPDPKSPALPPTIVPHHVVLRDRQTAATVIPFASQDDVPESLLQYLNEQFNKEIDSGDTYPMMNPLPLNKFARYWFQNFAGIMLLGHIESARDVVEGKDWSKECLGTFYIKPNYPGRSSHICNAGFIVTDASRNRGVGRLMGETYLEWAPKLGYTYSVFNLVYETNVASCKIWDGLGFKRIGRVKGAGDLKSHPDRLVDAIIFGRDLGTPAGSEEPVSEERFDKIKFYLKYGRYPNGADRAEKSRLRSAAMHYKLLNGDVLMLKDKEVISDPERQYDIAREVHGQNHTGINKCTATIAERYHWSRIKETVSDVIRVCSECKELGTKASSTQAPQTATFSVKRPHPNALTGAPTPGPVLDMTTSAMSRPTLASLADTTRLGPYSHPQFGEVADALPLIPPSSHTLQRGPDGTLTSHHPSLSSHNPLLQDPLHPAPLHSLPHPASSHPLPSLPPLTDPHLSSTIYHPIDPQIISHQPPSHHHHYTPYHPPHHHHHHHPPHDPEAATFQALLNASEDDPPPHQHQHHHRTQEEDDAERAAVDRDMEMLIEQPQDDEDEQHPQHPHPPPQPGATQQQPASSAEADFKSAVPAAMAAPAKPTTQSKMNVSHLLSTHEESEGEDGEATAAADGGGGTGLGGRGRGVYDGGFDEPPGGWGVSPRRLDRV